MKFAKRMGEMQASDIREIGKLTADPSIISFAGGMPDPDFFPLIELGEIAGRIIENDGKAALQYNTTQGYPPFRGKIADRMRKMGIQVSAGDLMIISGSQQGIDLCGRVFLDEGDGVVCESPSYSGALNAFSAYLPEFVEISTTDDGMDMDELEHTLSSRGNIKLIYVIPDFQNPTGRTWSLEKRKRLIALSNRFELPIIEDDPYSSFRFAGARIPSLKSLDIENRVIYLGTFSKALCPGLRVGWVAAGSEILNKIEIVKQVADIHSNSMAQREIDQYLEKYDLDLQIARVTSVYGRRKALMIAAMEQSFPDACRWTDPEGGIFIWVELPEPLSPGSDPDLVIVDFGRWYSLWDQKELVATHPERTRYQETVLWIGCSFNGQQVRFCVQTWVNKDFSLVRGMIMGFHKKFGETHKSIYHPLNPGMPAFGPGCRMGGRLTSHGELLMAGRVDIEEEIPYDQIPELMRMGQINLRYFPSMEPGGKPSICDLMQLEATDLKQGKAFRGKASIELLPSDLEEHTNLEVIEVLDGYYFENGATITGGKVIYSWV